MSDVVEIVKSAWGWTGIDPVEILAANSFGNLLLRAQSGETWRLCPEDLYCQVVAANDIELQALLVEPDFVEDWEMRLLVEAAQDKFGALEAGRVYCFKIPGILGGAYDVDNFGTISLSELINFSGVLAEKIRDCPPGTQVELKFLD